MTERDRQYGSPCIVDAQGTIVTLEPLVLSGDGDARSEAWLQDVIHRNPALLPISQLEPAFSIHDFKSVCREVPTPRGLIDNLLMSSQGDICLVETKLWRNHQARREAVVQALDYATCLFDLGYEEFERIVLNGQFAPFARPASLHDHLCGPVDGPQEEGGFIDAVADNLSRGRVLILIVGDGIRTEAEKLLDGLGNYAQFSFSIALVEMALFRLPDGRSTLVQPRTLARTKNIVRQVVQVGQSLQVQETGGEVAREVVDFWAALEGKYPGSRVQLTEFSSRLQPLQVWVDQQASLNLKWDPPGGGRPVNLGYIKRDGLVWFDAAAWSGVDKALALSYVEGLAKGFGPGCEVRPNSKNDAWSVYRDGRPIRLDVVLRNLLAWEACIREFIAALQAAHEAKEAR